MISKEDRHALINCMNAQAADQEEDGLHEQAQAVRDLQTRVLAILDAPTPEELAPNSPIVLKEIDTVSGYIHRARDAQEQKIVEAFTFRCDELQKEVMRERDAKLTLEKQVKAMRIQMRNDKHATRAGKALGKVFLSLGRMR